MNDKFNKIVTIMDILILMAIGAGLFLCYTWAMDLATHMIYIEQLLQEIHKTVIVPINPGDSI